MARWSKVADLATLRASGPVVVRRGARQILVLEHAGRILACNNRCPHEGYPLSEGTVDGACVLTCNWHNWKFELETGRNVYGGDRLRVYPVSLRDDEIWIDLADPPRDERVAVTRRALEEAVHDNDYARMAREIARLLRLDVHPHAVLGHAIERHHDRLEFGWTHAFAGMADWLTLATEHDDDPDRRLVCVLEAIAHLADDCLRRPRFPYPDARLAWNEDALVDAIEREDEARAIALIRGALDEGLEYEAMERGLTRAALAHYNDFGHSLIYVCKAGELIARLGAGVTAALVLPLVRSLVFATREDRIPEFRGYAGALARYGDANLSPAPPIAAWHRLGIDRALALATSSGRAPGEAMQRSLLGANAWNLLAFDLELENRTAGSIADNFGWLDFTHGITFANAVRRQCVRYPELWPCGVLQMACFAGRNARATVRDPEVDRWRVANIDTFFETAIDALFDHAREEFIVSVHLLKTVLAAREEVRVAPTDEASELLAAAVNRFLHSPMKRKHVLRTARQANAFVARDG